MILSLNIEVFSLGIAVAATAVLAAIVFLRNPLSVTSRGFLYFAWATILWDIANFSSHQPYPVAISFWLLKITIFIAVWHAFSLFHFLYVFPYERVKYPKWFLRTLLPVAIATSILNLTPFVFEKIAEVSPDGRIMEIVNGPGIAIFGIVVFGFIAAGLFLLLRKMIRAEGIEKNQHRTILVGMFFTFAFILSGNFLLPAFFNDPRFLPFGPLFFLPFLFFTFYGIVKYRLLNIKVLSVEILVFILAAVTLFEVVLAENTGTLILRLIVFSLSLFVGILIIRGVLREVEQREKLGALSEELASANEELKKLDQIKSEFISIAGHQLRAPLTVIKGYVSMTLEGSFGAITEKAKSALEKVFVSTEQLVKLIGDMLNLSRIESGRIQYEFKENDLVLLTKSVVGEYTPEAKKKNLKLVFKNDLGKIAKFIFDKDKMREVVINLIHNAIKYSPSGTILVRLAPGAEDANPSILLSVQDEGVGIKKEDISKLFIKFNRTEEVKTIDPNGMGIGLYFVKRVVEDHNGKAWAESEGLGKGSTFIVELPLKR